MAGDSTGGPGSTEEDDDITKEGDIGKLRGGCGSVKEKMDLQGRAADQGFLLVAGELLVLDRVERDGFILFQVDGELVKVPVLYSLQKV